MTDAFHPILIIPARRGSTGLPGKNMRMLAGKPLIQHAIECAKAVRCAADVVVSSDDPDVLRLAREQGVRCLEQPSDVSSNESPTIDAIRCAWKQVQLVHPQANVCCVMRATTPLRSAADVEAALDLLQQSPQADSVVSVCKAVGVDSVRLKRVDEDGYLLDAFEEEGRSPRRRQSLRVLYVRNGGVYARRLDAGTLPDGLWGNRCLAFEMPEERSVNINTEFQFRVAEWVLRHG